MKEVYNESGEAILVDDTTAVKTVDGKHYLLTTEDQAEFDSKNQEWQSTQTRRLALLEIARLESEITNRRIREAVLGIDGGWLINQESLIATERNKLGD